MKTLNQYLSEMRKKARDLRFKLKEPSVVTHTEREEIRKKCRESIKNYGHCENPYPTTWILRRTIWIEESSSYVRENQATLEC